MNDADATQDGSQGRPGRQTPATPPGGGGEWNEPNPATLPADTYGPAVVALGVTALGGGLVTSPYLYVTGAILVVFGLVRWFSDLNDE